jgi:hypothetical protein
VACSSESGGLDVWDRKLRQREVTLTPGPQAGQVLGNSRGHQDLPLPLDLVALNLRPNGRLVGVSRIAMACSENGIWDPLLSLPFLLLLLISPKSCCISCRAFQIRCLGPPALAPVWMMHTLAVCIHHQRA